MGPRGLGEGCSVTPVINQGHNLADGARGRLWCVPLAGPDRSVPVSSG